MRIAHVSDCYLPRTGGIETQVRALALAQAQAGHDVRIVTATPGHGSVRAGRDEVDGLPVLRVAARLPFELPVHPRTRMHVQTLLGADPVDVVHVHAGVVSPFAWGAIRATRRLGVPTLVTVHSIWGGLARPAFAAGDRALRWTGPGLAVSAVSERAAADVRRALGPDVTVHITPNGIDPALWQVEPIPGSPQELRVVSVLRMAPRKRTEPLVEAIAQAAERLPGVRVSAVLIGDGPERAGAQRRAHRRGMSDRIHFPGRLPRERILEHFAAADVYVQASVQESFGIAALEARSAGLPVVARSQSGTSGFVRPGIEGLLADDDAKLAQALVRLAQDRGLLERIAEHNRLIPPAQAWPQVLADVDSAYGAALGR